MISPSTSAAAEKCLTSLLNGSSSDTVPVVKALILSGQQEIGESPKRKWTAREDLLLSFEELDQAYMSLKDYCRAASLESNKTITLLKRSLAIRSKELVVCADAGERIYTSRMSAIVLERQLCLYADLLKRTEEAVRCFLEEGLAAADGKDEEMIGSEKGIKKRNLDGESLSGGSKGSSDQQGELSQGHGAMLAADVGHESMDAAQASDDSSETQSSTAAKVDSRSEYMLDHADSEESSSSSVVSWPGTQSAESSTISHAGDTPVDEAQQMPELVEPSGSFSTDGISEGSSSCSNSSYSSDSSHNPADTPVEEWSLARLRSRPPSHLAVSPYVDHLVFSSDEESSSGAELPSMEPSVAPRAKQGRSSSTDGRQLAIRTKRVARRSVVRKRARSRKNQISTRHAPQQRQGTHPDGGEADDASSVPENVRAMLAYLEGNRSSSHGHQQQEESDQQAHNKSAKQQEMISGHQGESADARSTDHGLNETTGEMFLLTADERQDPDAKAQGNQKASDHALLTSQVASSAAIQESQANLHQQNWGTVQACKICGGPGIYVCTGCGKVFYCSQACQSLHWTQGHYQECSKMT